MKKLLFWFVLLVLPALAQVTSTYTLTIPANDSLSNIVDIGTKRPSALVMPSAWTTAQITCKTGLTASVVILCDSDGNEVILETGPSRYILLKPQMFSGASRYFQLKSGTSTGAVAQGSARTITLVCRDQ